MIDRTHGKEKTGSPTSCHILPQFYRRRASSIAKAASLDRGRAWCGTYLAFFLGQAALVAHPRQIDACNKRVML
ncbi:hypothetical protein MGG_17475 [Pyricularia oryzae 70-15]|uniref:Uncharacterized protein n=1 Tax=Pyricularia oryzae (strain 70-15 / ATCC MYA-4617 / FGSC 8958) TaxID=242507 RepID=G4NCY4_PYRO7|nr:uncharacterized protein MGG_17475 [Pyricularia oryzae 70-15]EHA49174.1 hypothetical protein MGG_17475 [Pyricularia oryzae 70-15]